MKVSRRQVMVGCGALIGLAIAPDAQAAKTRAPRVLCPHKGCRNYRPDGPDHGLCGLSLRSPAAYPEEPLP